MTKNKNRGFASMDPEKQREIAIKGGKAASKNRAFMSKIGQIGGKRVAQNTEHMREIGRKGGAASAVARAKKKESYND